MTRPATVEALRGIIARARTYREAADAVGVERKTFWKWRHRWPEVAAVGLELKRPGVVTLSRSPLTLEQAIDHVAPFLPATSGQLNAALEQAERRGTLVHPVRVRSRQLSRYLGRVDPHGRMLVRRIVNGRIERNVFEWSIKR